MRIAAIILGVLALIATAVGIFFYWIGSALICLDACPPVSSVGPQLLRAAALSLGPGLLLSLAACILSLAVLRAQGRSTAFIVTLVTPFVAIALAALILYIAGGSLTPVAAGPADVAPANRQVSSDWVNATRYAVMPLVIWPLISLIAALLRPVQRRS
jgi:hypothetical protein